MKCILCENETNFSQYLEKDGELYLQCNICRLIFLKKNNKGKKLGKIYDKREYFSSYVKNPMVYIGILNQIFGIIEKYKKPGKILDIGCGIGLLLYIAKKRNWDGVGIEISKFALNYAKRKFSLNVINSDNLDNFQDNYFDVIVINHVLEHIENPLIILKQVRKKLNINGILFIGVPNINGFFPKFQKEKWPSLQPPFHIYQFTPRTLKMLLKKVGFKPIKFYTENRYFNYKFRILNSILNHIINPILEKLNLGEAMAFILIKND